MEYPLVHIIITTYDPGNGSRFRLLKQTIQSLWFNLKYPNVSWIISDDGSENFPEQEINMLLTGAKKTFFNVQRQGVGKSKNISLQHAFEYSPYVLLLEDDWVLKHDFDLIPHIKTLEENTQVGMVRFGYLGGEMTAKFINLSGHTYWQLDHRSGHYVYSGQVSLRHQRFYESVDYHAEGVQAGTEEEEMCHRYNNLENAPTILWDADYGCTMNAGPFINIGLDNSVNAVSIP